MRRVIRIAEPEFIITPLLQVPPASRGEPSRAPTRFPLLAGGTLRRGSSLSLIFANYGCAIGISSVHPPQPSPHAGREPWVKGTTVRRGVALTPCVPPGKGTTVRHEVFEAGAVFPSASLNGQARWTALTPFVPLSRRAGEGDYGVRKRSFRPHAEANASALQAGPRAAPLAHSVGEGLGVRAKKARLFPTQRTQVLYPYQLCPHLPLAGEGQSRAHRRAPLHPSPTKWERGGGEGKKWVHPAHSALKRCTLISLQKGGTTAARHSNILPMEVNHETQRLHAD